MINNTRKPHIVVVSNNYPSKYSPNRGAFVYNLVQQFTEKFEVTVIAPVKINELFGKISSGYGTEKCNVIRPIYPSFSNKKILGINFGRISFFFQKLAVLLTVKTLKKPISIFYTHFIINAMTVFEFAKQRDIPVVLASGESSYIQVKDFTKEQLTSLIGYLKKIICVSDSNRDFFLQYTSDISRIEVVPNAVDYNIFKPLGNRSLYKNRLGIHENKFLVGFIGHLIERKGPNRVIQAVINTNDDEIVVLCVGKGPQALIEHPSVIQIDPVSNSELPEIINAFDVFVLPTFAEGHCNVIEEVKACCVPIISSLGTTVEKQINDSIGFLVDPHDVAQITEKIIVLKVDNEKRQKMINDLNLLRGQFSVQERAKLIASYFDV